MLLAQIQADLKKALLGGRNFEVSTLRFLLSVIHNLEIAKYPPGSKNSLTEEDIIGVIQKEIREHQEAMAIFKKGNRLDLVKKEKKELAILKSYLAKK